MLQTEEVVSAPDQSARTMVIRPLAAAATSRSGLAMAAARPWPRNGVLAARTREVAAMIVDAICARVVA